MRRLALLLHIYQPPVQHEEVLRDIAERCYLPLIKLIKERKVNITMNIPLGLLEQMDRYGYNSWLKDVRELVMSERLELVGSGAYHPLLTKIPEEFAVKQIILNEYGLGYYFGKRGGFEGDPSIMIRNLVGFLSPELAVNEDTLKLADGLGYEWVMVDESSVPNEAGEIKHGLYKVSGSEALIVARNKQLSDFIFNKRNLNASSITSLVLEAEQCVASFGGEVFGYHFDQGITLFENLLRDLKKKGVELVTVSEYVRTKDEKELDSIVESTWNTSQKETDSGILYPRWDVKGNQIHKAQWEILTKVLKTYKPGEINLSLLGMEEVPVWLPDELSKIEDESLKVYLDLDLLILKAQDSCQFWCASFDLIKNTGLIERANALWVQIATEIGNKKLIDYVSLRVEKINKILGKA